MHLLNIITTPLQAEDRTIEISVHTNTPGQIAQAKITHIIHSNYPISIYLSDAELRVYFQFPITKHSQFDDAAHQAHVIILDLCDPQSIDVLESAVRSWWNEFSPDIRTLPPSPIPYFVRTYEEYE